MKYLYITLIGLILSLEIQAQADVSIQLIERINEKCIDTTELKNEFKAKVEYGIADKFIVYQKELNNLNDTISNSNVNDLFGPYYINDSIVFYKTLKVDSMKVARVGNIWIDQERGLSNSKKTAEEILRKVKAGKDFNIYCMLYSDDKNKNKDCDIGWFYYSSMVESFAKAVFSHKRGDMFLVQTKFGFHVVKMLEDIKNERKSTRYLKITVPNNGS